MKLFELFNNVAKWKCIEDNDDRFEAEFEISGVPYEFRIWTEGQYGNWGLEFANLSMPGDQHFGLSGQGNASAVIATVCNILKKFISNHDVYSIGFVAKELSRRSLYKRIIRTSFPDWIISQDESIITATHKDYSNIREGKVSDAYTDGTYNQSVRTTPPKQQMNYSVTINSKPWKDFPTESEAMRAANGVYNKNSRLRVSVVPK
jgi:hypothetical protein